MTFMEVKYSVGNTLAMAALLNKAMLSSKTITPWQRGFLHKHHQFIKKTLLVEKFKTLPHLHGRACDATVWTQQIRLFNRR